MAAYLSFLQSPSTANLASDASISYITTTTAIKEPTAILKHLAAQAKQLEKKEERVLSTIESDRGCCVETLTTLLFKTGGGAFLPSMDSNLLDEREVTFPLTHVVTYDAQSKIQQIRLYWDQGTLLKQVEAIGRTGRNWPIRDGKAQADFVVASVKAGSNGNSVAAGNNGKPQAARSGNENLVKEHNKRDSVSVTRDPHASLSLFAERDVNDEGRSYSGPKYGVAKSAKPAERDYGELFTNEESTAELVMTARSKSPHKTDGTILKAGAGKHHTGNRLFDVGENDMPKSPERKKTYNQKYEHFSFGDGEDVPTKENRPVSGKGQGQHSTTFSFEDFATPPKHVEKPKIDFERHWGAGVDEDDPSSPPKRPIVHAARKDADSHWEMSDESPLPAANKVTKSFQRQKGMGLYQDPTMDDDRTKYDVSQPVEKTATTNTDNARRGGDFSAGFAMVDNSPAGSKAEPPNKRGTRTEFTSNWGFDGAVDSPPIKKIYKTAGDGMGSRKVQDDSADAPIAKKIYKTAGDGMGSRSGGRAWGIGDESDPEVEADLRPSARSRRAQAQAGADLDF